MSKTLHNSKNFVILYVFGQIPKDTISEIHSIFTSSGWSESEWDSFVKKWKRRHSQSRTNLSVIGPQRKDKFRRPISEEEHKEWEKRCEKILPIVINIMGGGADEE